MPVVINGSNGISGAAGSASTPAIQGSDNNTGVFFPAADTAAITTDGTERMRITSNGGVSFGSSGTAYGSSGQVLVSNGDTTPTWGSAIVSGTAQATTSGTTKDFTGIPSWVKRITVMFNEVSTSGTSAILIQIGSGSVANTGYVSTSNSTNQSNSTAGASSTIGFVINSNDATFLRSGAFSILLVDTSNTYIASHTIKLNTTQVAFGGGSKSLSGALDRVRITTVNGTDTFDAGSVNILYE